MKTKELFFSFECLDCKYKWTTPLIIPTYCPKCNSKNIIII